MAKGKQSKSKIKISKNGDDIQIVVKDVVVTYPKFLGEESFNGAPQGTYGATFMIDNSRADDIAKIKKAVEYVREKKVKLKLLEDRFCLMNGELKNDPAYEGYHTLRAYNRKKSPPVVCDKDGKRLKIGGEDPFFSGCVCTIVISLWGQTTHGGRVNANLLAVKLVDDDVEPIVMGSAGNINEDLQEELGEMGFNFDESEEGDDLSDDSEDASDDSDDFDDVFDD